MAHRVTFAALFPLLALILLSPEKALLAQADGTESNLPEAGFGPPPGSTPVTSPTADSIVLPGNTPTPTIHVYSRETIVDVLVTDDKGNPVRGLTRNDFTISEDKRPQAIRGFSESSATAPPPPPYLPPDTFTNAYTLPPNGPVQIFLVERPAANTRQGGIAPVVPAGMVEYLRTMAPGTQVAIFTYSPVSALQLVQPFTMDGNSAAASAAHIMPEVSIPPGFGMDGYSNNVLHIAALEQIASYVASIHGRKNLIWITPGMPLEVVRDGGYGNARGAPNMPIVHRLMDVYEIFSREQISVYPVSPIGVHYLGFNTLRAQDVADQSGGVYFNTNDIKSELSNIVNRSSDTYTLSFVPPRTNEDARFHSIQISVDRPNVHLTYRTGYDDDHPRPPDGMLKADLQQGPMRLGALPATQLIFTLKVDPAPAGTVEPTVNIVNKQHAGSPKDRLYTVVFSFDPTQIAFSEAPNGKRTANLQFDLGAYDANAQLGPIRSQVIKLSVDPSGYNDFMHKPFHFTLPIPIPPGQQTLRAGLFDTVSGKAGTFQVPLNITRQ